MEGENDTPAVNGEDLDVDLDEAREDDIPGLNGEDVEVDLDEAREDDSSEEESTGKEMLDNGTNFARPTSREPSRNRTPPKKTGQRTARRTSRLFKPELVLPSTQEEPLELRTLGKNPDSAPSPSRKTSREPTSSKNDRQRATRKTIKLPEPELVMLSTDVSGMDSSLAGTTGRSTHHRKSSRNNEKAQNDQVRNSRRTENCNSPKGLPAVKSVKKLEPRTDPDVLRGVADHLNAMLSWALDVVGRALQLLKAPISYLLAIWMLFGLGILARNLITTSIYVSLSPICRIPGTSFLNLPFCPGPGFDPDNVPPVEFDKVMKAQSKLEEVLDESIANIGLPAKLKLAEGSVRDLRQVVTFSHIPSKNELLIEFNAFVQTAGIASYKLMRFDSHIVRTVDIVIATTQWTTRNLDEIQMREASQGGISAFINDKLLAPFQPVISRESALLNQYTKHTRFIGEEIQKLIADAQVLLRVLTSLENRLHVIYSIVTKDKGDAEKKKKEIRWEPWSFFGGNRSKLSKLEDELNLLEQVKVCRESAYAHVSGTVLKLQAMGAELEALRERAMSPESLPDRPDLPLSVQIEHIQRGLARLEAHRETAGKAEDRHNRQTLNRGQVDGLVVDG